MYMYAYAIHISSKRIHLYVTIYRFIYIYVYMYMHTHIHMYVYMYAYTHNYAWLHVYNIHIAISVYRPRSWCLFPEWALRPIRKLNFEMMNCLLTTPFHIDSDTSTITGWHTTETSSDASNRLGSSHTTKVSKSSYIPPHLRPYVLHLYINCSLMLHD